MVVKIKRLKKMTQTNIIIRFQVEGFHCFPKAKEYFPEVAFLSERHRHIFYFECEKKVFHDNRDSEFILFSREVKNFLLEKFGEKNICEFGSLSCEAISRILLEEFKLESCSVFEDNENGAKIYAI